MSFNRIVDQEQICLMASEWNQYYETYDKNQEKSYLSSRKMMYCNMSWKKYRAYNSTHVISMAMKLFSKKLSVNLIW